MTALFAWPVFSAVQPFPTLCIWDSTGEAASGSLHDCLPGACEPWNRSPETAAITHSAVACPLRSPSGIPVDDALDLCTSLAASLFCKRSMLSFLCWFLPRGSHCMVSTLRPHF